MEGSGIKVFNIICGSVKDISLRLERCQSLSYFGIGKFSLFAIDPLALKYVLNNKKTYKALLFAKFHEEACRSVINIYCLFSSRTCSRANSTFWWRFTGF